MKIELSDDGLIENHFVRNLTENFLLEDGLQIAEDQRDFKTGDFVHHERLIHIDGVYITFYKKDYKQTRLIHVSTDEPYMQLHFELYGGATYYDPHHPDELALYTDAGEFTFFYVPRLSGSLSSPICKDAFSVHIEISRYWLEKNVGKQLSVLGEFGDAIKNNQSAMLGHRSYPITTEISRAVYQLYQTPTQGDIKKIYVECKLLELLSLTLHQVNTKKDVLNRCISVVDTESLHKIKRMLANDLSCSYTIDELSSIAFMNRTKLQSCFQLLFGKTIHEYVTDLRLQTAYDLLIDVANNNLTIEDIANRMGYRYYNHFSTAFKKRYGKSPNQLRGK
ncbi:AraC family transcriptional regulator [Olivibacter ginsenosidimutans]|uniref:AraC family transcriptional regulator n=1 Tax=Olivibacter ginsenosidimutans TaxID=1176537 RepID=A0ABP9B1M4_9SPHI